jgi:hypothetical protein
MEIAVGQTVVLQGVENAGIDLTGKRGTVTAELPGGLVSVALAGGADVISVWPEHLKVVPSEPSDYFRATKLLGQPAITSGFYVGITRTTEVVGVDWNMFEDMRPSERTDAREELDSTAKRYDIDGGTISDALEDEELPAWVLEAFQTKSRAWRRQLLDLFATREEANRAAKDIVEHALTAPVPGSSLVHVAEGDRTIEEYNITPELTEPKPKPGSNGRLDKFKVPPSDTAARLAETSDAGFETYTANFFLYCDPFGADIYNVVSVTLRCSVHSLDD